MRFTDFEKKKTTVLQSNPWDAVREVLSMSASEQWVFSHSLFKMFSFIVLFLLILLLPFIGTRKCQLRGVSECSA